MVLVRRLAVLGFVLLGGCSESLFGAHHSGPGDDAGGGADGGDVPLACPDVCIADAAANFNGTATGTNGYWRYLDDQRIHKWAAMTGTTVMTGADQGNQITKCTASSTAPACRALPDALLVSTAGSQSNADPAIEFTAPADQVLQLSLHALVPDGAVPQTIRLYRNSREDVLFTGTAAAGATLARTVTLDALKGDRFLVAVAPPGGGATDVGLQLFVSAPPGTKFPSTCQLALPFESMSGNSTTVDPCRGETFTSLDPGGLITMVLANGPFMEQGQAVKLPQEGYVQDTKAVLDYSGDVTVQFWFLLQQFSSVNPAWIFSDRDPALSGGVGIVLIPGSSPAIQASAGDPQSASFTEISGPYLGVGSWQFVRVVRSRGNLALCLQGARLAASSTSTQNLMSKQGVVMGLGTGTDISGVFEGQFDDVRVITGALPCDPSP